MRDDFPFPDVEWPALSEFWAGAARGELRLPRCAACRSWRWYPTDSCEGCGLAAKLVWPRLSGRGHLFSWAIVHRAFIPAMADAVPYVSALVVLEEDPCLRLTTRIVDCSFEDLKGDMPVSVVFRPLTFAGIEGEVQAPLFVPRDTPVMVPGRHVPTPDRTVDSG